jgi:type II secretory pathway pseudopilin PulG
MSNSRSNKSINASGFTLIEVIAATFVITLGLFAAAAFAGRSATPSHRSKYKTLATTLASNKLQDLSRWGTNDPNVCVPTGSKSVGSLTTDVSETTTCPGGTADSVSYFDDVTMGATDNVYSETIRSTSGGSPVYVTTAHSADGSITINTTDNPPTNPPTFHRRWIIQRNSGAAGARRITVVVNLLDRSVHPTVTSKMTR